MNEEWRTVDETAQLICVTPEALYNRLSAGPSWPALESCKIHGVVHVRPSEAYDHFVKYGKRRPPRLQKPPGYGLSDTAPAAGALDPEIVAALDGKDFLSIDPVQLPAILLSRGVSPEKVRLAVTIANSHQRRLEAELRAGKNLPPDDVLRMLRSHGELLVEELDANAPRLAADLLKFVRETFSVDLARGNAAAVKQLESFLRGSADKTIESIRGRVDEQIRGVQRMEFKA